MPALAQTLAPVGVDLFGDGIVKPIPAEGHRVRIAFPNPLEQPKVAEGYHHLLLFHDGRQLRGTLAELTAEEVIWKRPDADAPIRFPRKGVRRIELKESGNLARQEKPPIHLDDAGSCVPATVKLPGADWLHGDLRSDNGQEFSLKLANGSTVAFAKTNVEWIYFGTQPAPAFGFFGRSLDLEGWFLNNTGEGIEIAGNSFLLPTNSWMGRTMNSTPRFQVEFVLPDSTKNDPVKLWLQPFSPSPNSYSQGTIELAFGPKDLGYLIYTNVFERKSVNYPKESDNAGEASRFAVFYDGPKNRVLVQRNGVTVGEWKLREEPPQPGEPTMDRRPQGLCFNREYGNQKLALGRMQVKPWNGEVAQGKQSAAAIEQITIGAETPKPSQLESVGEKKLIVNGQEIPRKTDIFIEFPNRPEGLASGDALLRFGDHGELSTADLRIREGRVVGRTSIVPDLDVSAEMLEGIIFPSAKSEAAAPWDALVFRNGDSLRGALLSASTGGGLRWKMTDGQEIAFQPEHVAGVRLKQMEPSKMAEGSVTELTNGDRITGEVLSLNRETLNFRHAVLGERSIARGRLQTLFTSPKTVLLDAGADPEVWMGLRPLKGENKAALQRLAPSGGRIFLDGTFLGSAQRTGGSYTYQGINYTLDKPPERYELRGVITDSGGSDPNLSLSLASKENASLQLSLNYGRLRIYGYNLGKRGAGVRQDNRQIALANKLSRSTTRREMRMFLDTKLGTVDLLVDGVHFYNLGKKPGERVPGLGSRISLSSYSSSGIAVLSNVSLRPWNGEVPVPGELKSSIQLENGDAAAGEIGELKDGKLSVNIGSDPIDVPVGRITCVEFAQPAATAKSAARLRLADGAIIHVDEFEWRDGSLTAKSSSLGDLQLAGKELAELILSPAPAYIPLRPDAKKLVSKEGEKAEGRAE